MKHLIRATLVLIFLTGMTTNSWAFDLFDTGVETRVTSGQGSPDIQSAQREAYNGPKARVAVSRFTNKTHKRWWSREIGDGMADQLTTALFNSGRFIVLERQTLSDVLSEQDLARSGRIQQGTGAPTGQIEGAELLITGAVTEFEGDAGGTSGGFGGKGGDILGALMGSIQKAHMAIDIRVIDARTSRILAATSVEGSSSDVDLGGALGAYWGNNALGGALSSWENTPKEKALRMCIERAVDFIVSKTPASYYHYGSGTSRTTSSAPASQAGASRTAAAAQFRSGDIVSPNRSSVNVRRGPGTDNPIAFSAGSADPLRVIGRSGSWLHIETQDSQNGWIAGWLVAANHSISPEDFKRPPKPARPTPPTQPVAGPPAGTPGPVERLKKLKALHDQGLITKDEYDTKRQEILEAL